jgi:hypothetical protein
LLVLANIGGDTKHLKGGTSGIEEGPLDDMQVALLAAGIDKHPLGYDPLLVVVQHVLIFALNSSNRFRVAVDICICFAEERLWRGTIQLGHSPIDERKAPGVVTRKDDSRQHIDDLVQKGALLHKLALDALAGDDLIVQAAVGGSKGRGALVHPPILLALGAAEFVLQALALSDLSFEGAAKDILSRVAAIGRLWEAGFRLLRPEMSTLCRLWLVA